MMAGTLSDIAPRPWVQGERNGRSRLSAEAVHRIRWALDLGASSEVLAQVWDVDCRTITKIARRELWSYLPERQCPWPPSGTVTIDDDDEDSPYDESTA
jgi:hypothetical protein